MRKEIEVVIQPGPGPGGKGENRDAGKKFLLKEFPAVQIEKFGLRVTHALASSGITVPQDMADAGAVGAALIFYQALIGARFEAIEPLWDEMLTGVQFVPSQGFPMPLNPLLIEEVSTLTLLRGKVLELNTGFTLAELAQKFKEAASAKIAAMSSSSITSTSQS